MGSVSLFPPRLSGVVFVLTAALLSGGCVHDETNGPSELSQKNESLLEVLAHSRVKNKEEIIQGVTLLINGDYRSASTVFNSALMDDPKDPALHYLNGYTYHVMSERGDGDKYELAAIGYCNALEFDPSNWLVYLQLGRVLLKQKKYASAQEAFANVLLYKANHPEALYDLAVASYYAHDLNHALQYITKAVELQPGNTHIQRSAAIITAAAGEKERSHQYYEKYKKQAGSRADVEYVGQRLADWENNYSSGLIHLAQADTTAAKPATPAAAAHQAKPTPEPAEDNALGPDEMVIIDGTVLRVSEEGTTSKGNNILDNLTAAITLNKQTGVQNVFDNVNGHHRTETITHNRGFNIYSEGTGLIGQVAAPATLLLYSLNIASVYRQHVEVIGRTTLAVSIGKDGEFYSGNSNYIPIQGDRGGSIEKLPIGIGLKVTPVSISGNIVTLKVSMTGQSEITAPAPNTNATQQYLTISDSHVITEVKAKIGETVVLGGIKLRDQFNDKQGVPFLQDIPGVEYIFSNETTQNDLRTVMYLLTVRGYAKDMKATKAAFVNEDIDQPSLQELDFKNKNWFNPTSNTLAMFKTCASLYREYRTADLIPIQWYMSESLTTDLNEIAPFIIY